MQQPRRRSSGFDPWRPGRQCIILGCQLAMFVGYPLVRQFFPGVSLLLEVFLLVILAAAAYAFIAQRTTFLVMLVLLITGTILMLDGGQMQLR